ncbi:hypothetical protein OIU34_02355 [Pararhizobium sp. BT-229]|uniref:hypothetical protein n=1 Tax=Pararhizobium sp. BT-229 TaxID=2986923 RepID=UPI0021F7A0BA|nr:hypothetical protein [Pararhizobium sp. BT-229]MCV9960729.1 hypothetical protein [Pararhizobium sp. BT-229]
MTVNKSLVVLASLRADLQREAEGDWIKYPAWKGVEFNVSALTKPEYETARDLMFKRLGQLYPESQPPKEIVTAELGSLFCDHILHGWRGLDVPYTPEVARETLTNPEYRAVVSAVEFCAVKITDIEVKFTAAEKGNSSPPSERA